MGDELIFPNDLQGLEAERLQRRLRLAEPEKIALGQFFTRQPHWLVEPVKRFIQARLHRVGHFLDPFAGEGDLLRVCGEVFGLPLRGLDISVGSWQHNDSLERIPGSPHSLIVTNPPYLARNSARRKGLWPEVGRYLDDAGRQDLYQVALDRCLEAAEIVVAIVPETILLSTYPKSGLVLACVIQDELFSDTDTPVAVVCFDKTHVGPAEIRLGSEPVGTLTQLIAARPVPSGTPPLVFNDPRGQIGLRAVDGLNPQDRIRFVRAGDLGYSLERLKHSSRHLTFVWVPGLLEQHLESTLGRANEALAQLRERSSDLALSPFKGNNRDGVRRRRLDYTVARALLEQAVSHTNPRLF